MFWHGFDSEWKIAKQFSAQKVTFSWRPVIVLYLLAVEWNAALTVSWRLNRTTTIWLTESFSCTLKKKRKERRTKTYYTERVFQLQAAKIDGQIEINNQWIGIVFQLQAWFDQFPRAKAALPMTPLSQWQIHQVIVQLLRKHKSHTPWYIEAKILSFSSGCLDFPRWPRFHLLIKSFWK